jgi:Adenosylcobinamide amidohydrolase
MDPAVHVTELAAGLGPAGAGAGLLTAASVTGVVHRADEGVHAAATVGLRVPAWAAVPHGPADRELVPAWRPGTINIIVSVPVPLRDAAYVNAVMTATEAKTQAVLEAGVPRHRYGHRCHLRGRPGGRRSRGLRRAVVAVGRPDRPRGACRRARRRATLPDQGQPAIGVFRRPLPGVSGGGRQISRVPAPRRLAGSRSSSPPRSAGADTRDSAAVHGRSRRPSFPGAACGRGQLSPGLGPSWPRHPFQAGGLGLCDL